MSTHTHDIDKEIKGYLLVFGALLVFTVLTVAASYLKLPLVFAVALALCIATVKASLVACYFMHLISEKKMVYIVLTFAAIFFLVLMSLPAYEHHDIITGSQYLRAQGVPPHAEHSH